MMLRQSLQSARYARPWQQLLIASALIVGGIVLTVVGPPAAGLILTLVGCAFFINKAQLWLARRREGAGR